MTYNKYKIHHVDLVSGIHPVHDETVPAHYFVFWFKSVPLGQCFLSREQASDPVKLQQECIKSIRAALVYYGDIYGFSNRIPQNGTLSALRPYLDTLASVLHPASIPETCDVSVVICTRNRAEYLNQCLKALTQQVCRPVEIIVVDNASDTNDTELVASKYGVRYVREDKPGLDIARNTGATSAKHEIVAYTDDDTIPDIYWAYRIYETFKNPAIAATTGLVVAGSLNCEAEIIFEKYWPFNRGYVPKIYDSAFFNATLPSGPPVWEIGAGANMAFRKSVFEDVGYFDERLDVGAAGCSGDSELWYRILATGLIIQYNPLAMVKHYHRDSIKGLKRQLYAYMRGFTVAILIQHQRFGHIGNLKHLFKVVPLYYLSLLKKGFPFYNFQYKTLLSELSGIVSGMIYFLRHRNTNPGIRYDHETYWRQ